MTRRRRLLERLVVLWCRLSRTHFIEPWVDTTGFVGLHSGCVSCTWCEECGELRGREEVPLDDECC